MNTSLRVAVLGAGNLATRVAIELYRNGSHIVQVYSRTIESASRLAAEFDCAFVNQTSDITHHADIYLIALSDKALGSVLKKTSFKNKLIVHTAGSVPMSFLSDFSDNYGVFYPLQTFSKNRELNFGEIPICIEANNTHNLAIIKKLAFSISDDVRIIDSEKRRQLHLAAVFACNFVNHMYTLSYELIKDKNISFDILRPLIAETAAKIEQMEPPEAQTGPAVRMDMNVIQKHLESLSDKPETAQIYKALSESINLVQKQYKP